LIYFLYQEVYRNITAQYEAKMQELQKVMKNLQRRLEVCMPADMDWNIIGSFI
jgi:hypothetical protein